jgi:hypothetical protein
MKRSTVQGREVFAQEFPICPEEAFLASGMPVFDSSLLQQLAFGTKKPLDNVPLNVSELLSISDGLEIWELPDPAYDYVIFADCAEGLENNDFDSADVLCVQTGNQVASLHGHYGPTEYSRRLSVLGRFYNTAFLGAERNNHGHAVLLALIEGTATVNPYPGELYYHTDQRAGWHTTPTTKPRMMFELQEALVEREIKVNSATTIAQMKSFVHQNGRIEGTGKKKEQAHDDKVISIAGANQMRLAYLRPGTVFNRDKWQKALQRIKEQQMQESGIV